MQPTASSNSITARAFLHFTIVILLFIAAAVHLGCRREPTNQGAPNQQSNAAPSPTTSPLPETDKYRGDTIIVIKDGSTTLDEINGECQGTVSEDITGVPKAKYVCTNKQLSQVIIQRTVWPSPPPSPLPTPVECKINDSNASVKVDAGGGRNDITIKNKTNKVEIEFRFDVYPLDNGQAHKHRNETNHVKGVTINEKPCGVCNQGENCWISFK